MIDATAVSGKDHLCLTMVMPIYECRASVQAKTPGSFPALMYPTFLIPEYISDECNQFPDLDEGICVQHIRNDCTPISIIARSGCHGSSQVIFWVLGEYGGQADIGAAGVMEKLAATAERQSLSDTARGYMLTAIAKLCAQVRLHSRVPPWKSIQLVANRR